MNGYPPGLAHRNTEVTIPLGNYVALVGAYEGKSRTIEVNAQTVAEVNMRTISTAERQIYVDYPEQRGEAQIETSPAASHTAGLARHHSLSPLTDLCHVSPWWSSCTIGVLAPFSQGAPHRAGGRSTAPIVEVSGGRR